jgi:L-ascorbate metabolism protein UlaG (beta-lactamase superfamily)
MKEYQLPYGVVRDITQKENIELIWFGHSCFKVRVNGTSLFLDPVRKNELLRTTLDPLKENNPTAIFISHEHWDHLDPDTILGLRSPATMIYGPPAIENPIIHKMTFDVPDMRALEKNKNNLIIVIENDILEINDIKIKCLLAQEGLSYLLSISDLKLLFMGDSTATSQMIDEHPDVILFPIWAISGVEAKLDDFLTLAEDPLCIPMHYHTTSSALPNFYVDLKKIKELIPEVNMKILKRNETFKI